MVEVHCRRSCSSRRVWPNFSLSSASMALFFFNSTNSTQSVFLNLWPPAVSKETDAIRRQQHIKTIWIYRQQLMSKNSARRKVCQSGSCIHGKLASWESTASGNCHRDRPHACAEVPAGEAGLKWKHTGFYVLAYVAYMCAGRQSEDLPGQHAHKKTLFWKMNASQDCDLSNFPMKSNSSWEAITRTNRGEVVREKIHDVIAKRSFTSNIFNNCIIRHAEFEKLAQKKFQGADWTAAAQVEGRFAQGGWMEKSHHNRSLRGWRLNGRTGRRQPAVETQA